MTTRQAPRVQVRHWQNRSMAAEVTACAERGSKVLPLSLARIALWQQFLRQV